jgi:disulfide bond formation protein DsbB
MRMPQTHSAAILSVVAAGLGLGIALASQRWGGLVPCALCLLERWPYRVAIVLGLVAFFLPAAPARLVLALTALTMLASAALAAVHVGVEQGWWQSPLPECAGPQLGTGGISERLAAMPLRPAKPCDAPSFLVPGLPLSMAAMNLMYSLVFAGLLVGFLSRKRSRA